MLTTKEKNRGIWTFHRWNGDVVEARATQLDPDLFHRDSFDAPATFALGTCPLSSHTIWRARWLHRANTIAQRAPVIIALAVQRVLKIAACGSRSMFANAARRICVRRHVAFARVSGLFYREFRAAFRVHPRLKRSFLRGLIEFNGWSFFKNNFVKEALSLIILDLIRGIYRR